MGRLSLLDAITPPPPHGPPPHGANAGGATSISFTLTAVNDDLLDSGETIQVHLSAPTITEGTVGITAPLATATITDLDPNRADLTGAKKVLKYLPGGDRVQKYFEESFGIDSVLVSTQIDKAISDLREQRVIDLEATNFIPEGEDDTAEADFQKAEAEVREMITDAFFTPALEPHQETKDGWDKAVDLANSISRLAVTGGASSLTTFTRKQVD
jgi:hypothetical protein